MLRTGWKVGVRGRGSLVAKRRVEGQFVTESLLFTTVSKPVVYSNFSNQVGAEASKLGGRHAPLEAFGPERRRVHICAICRFKDIHGLFIIMILGFKILSLYQAALHPVVCLTEIGWNQCRSLIIL